MKIDRSLFPFAMLIALLGCSRFSAQSEKEMKTERSALGEACDEHHLCGADLSCISGRCQKDPCIYGLCQKSYSGRDDPPLCLLNPGERTMNPKNCVRRDVYEEDGSLKCAYLPGSDCSKDPKICGHDASCVEGVCKIDLHQSCSADSDCAKGICRKWTDRMGNRFSGKVCVIAPGEPAEDSRQCLIDRHTYLDQGIRKCAYPVGSPCSENPEICGESLSCVQGTCRIGLDSLECNADSDCAEGSCQMNANHQKKCLFRPGDPIQGALKSCAYHSYEENGIRRCSYLSGSDCLMNAEICDHGSSCIEGVCKRKPGEDCEQDSDCAIGTCQEDSCFLEPGSAIPEDCKYGSYVELDGELKCRLCKDGAYEDEDGIWRCAYPEGSDCSKDEKICGMNQHCFDGICFSQEPEPCDCEENLEPRCKDDADCDEGEICCEKDQVCRLKPGEKTTASNEDYVEECSSFAAYRDHEILRCAYPAGSDCSKDQKICGTYNACVRGRCKIALYGYGCREDQDCQAGICSEGKCRSRAGEQFPKNPSGNISSGRYCATDDFYEDHGVLRCAFVLGSDCSKDSTICGQTGTCVEGVCKLKLGEKCRSDSDCARGVCFHGRCRLDAGELTESEWACISMRVYEDDGKKRCAYEKGSDCSKDARICGEGFGYQCIEGICRVRKKPGERCKGDEDCIEGSCRFSDDSDEYTVLGGYVKWGYCLLDPGAITTNKKFCVTGEVYEDGDHLRCKSEDCEAYPEHCGKVICKDGRCGPLLGKACQP